MASAPTNRSDYLWLGVILLIGLVARIVGLNGPLWYDEILTVERHLRLPWADMMQGYSMNNHYLFNLQSKLAMGAFGETPWAIRLPAMLFGIGSIATIWWLARDIASAKVAHITALLLALSYHHIWFSQNARGYSELAFFSALGMVLFLRGMARPTLAIWLAYGVTLALAVFTHLTGAFLFAAQGIIWLILAITGLRGTTPVAGRIRLPLLGYLFGAALTLAFYAPLLPSLLSTVGEVSGTSAIDVMQEYQNPIWSLLEGVRTALGATGPLVSLVAIAVVALTVLGGVNSHTTRPLFAPTVLIHIGLTLVLLIVLGMRIWPRFFFADIGFVMLLIVLGVQYICGLIRKINAPLGSLLFKIGVVGMVVISLGLATRNYMAPKQNLAGAYELIEEIREPGERVLSAGHASAVFLGYFAADWQEVQTNEDYEAARAVPGPLLVAVAFPARTLRKIPTLDADTETTLELVQRFPGTLGDGAVLIFRRSQ